jgi:hypothetical protein
MAARPVSLARIELARNLTELGYTCRQIAEKLGTSMRNVERYKARAYGRTWLDRKANMAQSTSKVPEFPMSDEYAWKRCRTCKAKVIDGWKFLHDADCPDYADDRDAHPRPVL